jgi:hypothetical protein
MKKTDSAVFEKTLKIICDLISLPNNNYEIRQELDALANHISSLHDFEYIVIHASYPGKEPGVIYAKAYHDNSFFDEHIINSIDIALSSLRSIVPKVTSYPANDLGKFYGKSDDHSQDIWFQYDLPAVSNDIAYGVISLIAKSNNQIDINDPIMKIISHVTTLLLVENCDSALKKGNQINRSIQQNFVANLTHDLRNP